MKIITLLVLSFILNACITTENKNEPNQQAENIALIQQYYEYFNRHDWQKMAELYTEKAAFKDPTMGNEIKMQNKLQIIETYTQLNQIFPDIRDEIINIYPSGNQHVIVEFISTGTAPDSSKLHLPICTIFTIENGKISKDFTYYDNKE